MTSEPGVIVENSYEEADSANRDFGHCLKMLLSAKVEIVSWGKHILALQNWSFPGKIPLLSPVNTLGDWAGDIIAFTNLIFTLFHLNFNAISQ